MHPNSHLDNDNEQNHNNNHYNHNDHNKTTKKRRRIFVSQNLFLGLTLLAQATLSAAYPLQCHL